MKSRTDRVKLMTLTVIELPDDVVIGLVVRLAVVVLSLSGIEVFVIVVMLLGIVVRIMVGAEDGDVVVG